MRHTPGLPVWQRNYDEHIIRDDVSLDRIREYIVHNPAQWALDREHPDTAGARRNAPHQNARRPQDEPWRI